jgi:hypothetical protein
MAAVADESRPYTHVEAGYPIARQARAARQAGAARAADNSRRR